MNIAIRPSMTYIPLFTLLVLGAVATHVAGAAEPTMEITIEGSEITREVVRPTGGSVIPTEVVTLTRHVNFADLDLSTHSGAVALNERVAATAKAACGELDRALPFSASHTATADCVRNAKKGALPQVQAAIEHAEQERVATR